MGAGDGACLASAEELPETLWGAAVPNNFENRTLRDLVAEMYDDFDYTMASEN